MGVTDLRHRVDFALAFAVVHEFPDAACFFTETASACRPDAQMLMAEPAGHAKAAEFEAELGVAKKAGFRLLDRPTIRAQPNRVAKKLAHNLFRPPGSSHLTGASEGIC